MMSEEPLPAKFFPVDEVRPVSRGWILFGLLFYWLSIIGALLFVVLVAVSFWNMVPKEIKQSAEVRMSQKGELAGQVAGKIAAAAGNSDKKSGDAVAAGNHETKAQAAKMMQNTEGVAAIGVIALVYGLIFVGVFCWLPMLIIFFTTVHRAWRCMQCLRVVAPWHAIEMNTPTVAVGLLFCPYFNIYWIFPALLRLEEYGRILAERRGMAYRGPESSAIIIFLILNFTVAVPVIGWALWLFVVPFLWYSLMKKFNNMIEDLGKPGLISLSE